MKNGKETRKLSELRGWKKNPRNITKKGFERLLKQTKRLGQYKPIIITPDNEVIGGNMRLKAYRELNIQEVWVSVVNPKDDNEKMEYALSDNDRAGYYDSDLLANMMPDYDIGWDDYTVDLTQPKTIDEILSGMETYEIDESIIKPFKKTHVLISFEPSLIAKIEKELAKIKDTDGVDYETGSN